MHPYIHKCEKPCISTVPEIHGFCLLRRCPNPRRTQICVLETLQKSSGYAILHIADSQVKVSIWLPCKQSVAVAGGNNFIEWILQENNKGQHRSAS